MRRALFDIETDGLLDSVTKIHCIVIADVDSGTVSTYRSDQGPGIRLALGILRDAEELIGQNIIDFDVPAIQKLYPDFNPRGKLTDTLVLSRLIWPHMKDLDFGRLKKNPTYIPGNLVGSFSLEAWGHRLGFHKGDYAKQMKDRGLDPWAEINDDMVDYCVNDVRLTLKLLSIIEDKHYSQRAIDLEHAVFRYCSEQTKRGVWFDESAAVDLTATLSAERANLELQLKSAFGVWYRPLGVVTPKRSQRRKVKDDTGAVAWLEQVTEGASYTKVELTEFNPGSRDHIAKRLMDQYGWKPTVFTNTGKPVIDEDTLAGMHYPECKLLQRYLLIEKRLGMLSEGRNAWLKLVKNGRIHGRLNTNGAVTGRATHSDPNLGQVPSVGSPYGAECRALFGATPGHWFVGADAAGLELRCLAHYMGKWDKGAYADIVVNGDIHWANVIAMGLMPEGTTRDDSIPEHKKVRNIAKTFIYAFLYGAGDEKIGTTVGKGKRAGAELRKKFLEGLPALANLVSAVKAAAAKGHLVGLDGRHIPIRSEHAALNSLLQGAGAIIMKQAMVNWHELMKASGYRLGVDYWQVLWVHDEFQAECRTEEIAAACGSLMVEGIRKVTQDFNLRCPLDGEFKIGKNWKETH